VTIVDNVYWYYATSNYVLKEITVDFVGLTCGN